jgi:hypothetical protein
LSRHTSIPKWELCPEYFKKEESHDSGSEAP